MDAAGLLILIIIFQVKHFVADYLLQGKYMLGKFKVEGWEAPLIAHCAVHMALTFLIIIWYIPLSMAMYFALVDMSIHFIIDRVKVVLSRDYNSATDKEFWWALGADQMAHHFTHYGIALAVMLIINEGL